MRKDLSSENFALPEFAALSRCLVVDPSFRSRGEVIKKISDSKLFENSVVPDSLNDAQRMIREHKFDACFLGPSLTASKAQEFISAAVKNCMADDCAFIVIAKSEELDQGRPLEEGAHGQIPWPALHRDFFEGAVIAILKANKGKIWPGIRLSEDGKTLIFVKEEIPQASPKGEQKQYKSKPKAASSASQRAINISLSFLRKKILENVSVDIRSDWAGAMYGDEKSEDSSAELYHDISRVLREVLHELPSGEQVEGSELSEVNPAVAEALMLWLDELDSLGKDRAMEKLYSRLLSLKSIDQAG